MFTPTASHRFWSHSIEMYDSRRFFTVTGNHLKGTPLTIEPRQAELTTLHAEVLPHSGKRTVARPPVDPLAQMDDDTLLLRALNARNGEKFGRLFAGDTSGYDGDDSRADLALCGILAFWTQDPEQMDRLFRRSGLMREKWERADYRERTIEKAIQNTPRVYASPILFQGNQSERTWGGVIPRTYETEVPCAEALGLREQAEGLAPCSHSEPFT
jgi:primase-polymerase (primpol)-like protein